MPTYLIHGFRWPRHSIRIHIILNDLEDAAAEWILAPATSLTLLTSFYKLFDFLPPLNVPSLSPDAAGTSGKHGVGNGNQERREGIQVAQEATGTKQRAGFKHRLKRVSSAVRLRGGTSEQVSPNGNRGSVDDDKHRSKTSATTSRASSVIASSGVVQAQDFKLGPLNDWSPVKLLEQYDPDNTEIVSQPYAYVADHVVTVSLGVSLTEEIALYESKIKAEPSKRKSSVSGSSARKWSSASAKENGVVQNTWFEKLRDSLQKDAQIGWFIVVCGDEERAIPTPSDGMSEASYEERRESVESVQSDPQKTPTKTRLRRFFSRKNLRESQ